MRGSERFTQRASTAIRKAHDAAAGMGHSYVGTEHILLGIIREGEGLGARILADNALTDSVLTRMVTETVGRGVPGEPLVWHPGDGAQMLRVVDNFGRAAMQKIVVRTLP